MCESLTRLSFAESLACPRLGRGHLFEARPGLAPTHPSCENAPIRSPMQRALMVIPVAFRAPEKHISQRASKPSPSWSCWHRGLQCTAGQRWAIRERGGYRADKCRQCLTAAALETRLGLHEILQEVMRSSLESGGDDAMRYQRIALSALSLGLAGMTSLALPAQGQGHGGRGFAFAGPGAAHVSRGRAVGGSFVRMRHGRRGFVGSGFGPNYYPYYDSADYYPDYDPQDEVGEAAPAPLRAPTAAPASPAKPPESLVMELRGDQWVRLTSHGPMETSEESSATESGRAAASVHVKGAAAPTQPPSEL